MSIPRPFLRSMEIAQLWPLTPLWSDFEPFRAPTERKYEILAQNWTLRKWSDIAILKLSMAKVNRGESGKVFKHSKNQLWASWDHFWGLCKLPTFAPSCLSEPILVHFYFPESENMRFWLKIELWENNPILRFWSFLWPKLSNFHRPPRWT